MSVSLKDAFAVSAESDVARTAHLLMSNLVASGLRERLEGGAWDAQAWSALNDMGLPLALCQEGDGGGFTWIDMLPALEALGSHQIGLPLSDTMIGNGLLSSHGGSPRGGVVMALGDARSAEAAELVGDSLGYKICGRFANVAWARHAEEMLLSLPFKGRRVLCTVRLRESAHADVHVSFNTAGEPRDTVVLKQSPVSWWADIGSTEDRCPVRYFGALGRSAMTVGACESALSQTLTHCKDRIQFGQALERFQVVQHAIAVMATQFAAAATAVATAFAAADSEPGFAVVGTVPFDIATAKCVTDEAAARCRESAHQLHGAMGFTHEHSLHHATRRLWAWRRDFGDASDWATELGAAAVATGGQGFWSWLVARGDTR